jgi:hypothetical protein
VRMFTSTGACCQDVRSKISKNSFAVNETTAFFASVKETLNNRGLRPGPRRGHASWRMSARAVVRDGRTASDPRILYHLAIPHGVQGPFVPGEVRANPCMFPLEGTFGAAVPPY